MILTCLHIGSETTTAVQAQCVYLQLIHDVNCKKKKRCSVFCIKSLFSNCLYAFDSENWFLYDGRVDLNSNVMFLGNHHQCSTGFAAKVHNHVHARMALYCIYNILFDNICFVLPAFI